MHDRTEQAVQLPDGRTMGFAEYGDPDGAAVVALHGIPASGLGYWVLDEAARGHHVRVLAPDRPGIRASSRRKGFTVADAGADVSAFARLLGLEQFGLLGWSGGGPYALAVAADPPPGLGRVVVVWQGSEDIAVRPAAADEIARRLPTAERRDFPGEGHLLPFSHTGELVALFAPG